MNFNNETKLNNLIMKNKWNNEIKINYVTKWKNEIQWNEMKLLNERM